MNRRIFVKRSLLLSSTVCLAPLRQGVTAQPDRPLVIDAHCHAGSGLNYGKLDADPWTTFNDPQWTLRRMEEAGIDRTIIFPISNATYEKANEEIASFARRWPDKFIGFAKHDAKTEAGKIRDLLRREVRELGLKGLKLHGVPSPEMVETAEELRIPILFHPPKVLESLEAVRSAPKVAFIMAHLGNFASRDWKEHVRAIEAAKAFPNLYLETSSVVFVDYLERAAKELPAEKLIFGSDGPLVDSRVELHKIRLLKLPPEKERLVLSGNILRLLGQ
ncbi:MAG: amidohydrolase family protein [Verrucomicrobia bacterium]|nr:amidohydrolase family protein [Verrucomicrobiota bacterium]